ncbi:MAG: YegP family protein [Clostridia bacterium]|nr:YegP family protein [Clostridia bacterium]
MGKFVIVINDKGNPHFNLLATNGQIIGTSEVYNSMAACKNGIESVKKCVDGEIEDTTVEGFETVKHPKFVVSQDKAGKFRFNLKAKNGEIILSSQSYETKVSCINGVNSVKKNAPDAEVVDAE